MSADQAVKYGVGGAAAGAPFGPIGAGIGGGLGALYGAFQSNPSDDANAKAAALRQQASALVQQKMGEDAALRRRLLEQRMAMFAPVNAQMQKMYGINMRMPDVSGYFTQPGGGGQAPGPSQPPPAPTPGQGGWTGAGGGLGTIGSVGRTVSSLPSSVASPVSALLGAGGSSGGIMDYVNSLKNKQQGQAQPAAPSTGGWVRR